MGHAKRYDYDATRREVIITEGSLHRVLEWRASMRTLLIWEGDMACRELVLGSKAWRVIASAYVDALLWVPRERTWSEVTRTTPSMARDVAFSL